MACTIISYNRNISLYFNFYPLIIRKLSINFLNNRLKLWSYVKI